MHPDYARVLQKQADELRCRWVLQPQHILLQRRIGDRDWLTIARACTVDVAPPDSTFRVAWLFVETLAGRLTLDDAAQLIAGESATSPDYPAIQALMLAVTEDMERTANVLPDEVATAAERRAPELVATLADQREAATLALMAWEGRLVTGDIAGELLVASTRAVYELPHGVSDDVLETLHARLLDEVFCRHPKLSKAQRDAAMNEAKSILEVWHARLGVERPF